MNGAESWPWSERLRQERIRHNWRQQDLADQLGTTVITVKRWERGRQLPSSYFREKLCTLFGATAEELGFVSSIQESAQEENEISFPLWNVPYRRNHFFTGREECLVHIHAQLQLAQEAETSMLAISGLGGIGKTQLALEYAYRYRHHYAATFWLQADTPERLRSELAALAALFHLPERKALDQEQAVRAVKRWFEEHANWLLILDNVEDVTLVSDMIPSGRGHVLLTTRAQASGSFARQVNLEKMTLDEGMLFLLRRIKLLRDDESLEQIDETLQAQAQAIVRELDGLPLALDQAGAYIEETGCGVSGYLERYQTRKADLLKRRGRLSIDHPESVSTTFALSFERVERMNEAGADVLRLCAFLDPDAIPEELFTESASELGPILATIAADPLAFDEMLALLRSYSLVHRHADTRTLTVHRLVQVVLRERMSADTRRLWVERALRAVHRVFPPLGMIDTRLRCQRYLAHALCCIQFVERERLFFPEAMQLLTRTGIYLRDRACYAEAELLLQQALHIHEQLEFPAYQDLAVTLHQLGRLYFEQGCYAQAETCWQQTIALQNEHLERHSRERIETLNQLALLYMGQNRIHDAEPLIQQALLLWERMEAYSSVGILSLIVGGWCYVQQGRYQEAEPLLRRALALEEQEEPENLYVIHGFCQIGCLYELEGDYHEAEKFFQRGLALWERLEFPHPCVAIVCNHFASLRIRQQRYDEAEAYFRRAIATWEQLGFPYSLASESFNGLALLMIERGNDTEAEPLLRRALTIREQWLGKEHPETIATAEHYEALLRQLHQEGAVKTNV
jgi:tetratricopeptide (TPR) repeat protein/DNA-binding XRE family transcriptional regulator